jgi:hypothetical protein
MGGEPPRASPTPWTPSRRRRRRRRRRAPMKKDVDWGLFFGILMLGAILGTPLGALVGRQRLLDDLCAAGICVERIVPTGAEAYWQIMREAPISVIQE